MKLLDLKLKNFRNYQSLKISFSPKMNLIIGTNGVGKTNLIEAIYVLAITKSFKSNYDEVLVKNNEKSAKIEGNIEERLTNNYVIELDSNGKKAKINKTNIPKLSDYISRIQVILFSSNDLKLIKDSPSVRRKLLNVEISQINNNYLKYLNEYNKIIKQRNAYLKILYTNKMASRDYLHILNDKVILYGTKIMEQRQKFIEQINRYLKTIYNSISNIDSLILKYHSDYWNITEEEIRKKYEKLEEKDIILGKTSFGVHMDDIEFTLDNYNLKDYGSEGQQKNAIIAFKLSELKLYKEEYHSLPILIIDDLYSELDKYKINSILENLDPDIQTFITVTDLNKVKKSIRNESKIIKIKDGVIEYEK